MDKLTRAQAIALAGTEAVEAVDALNCEPTSRCVTDGDDRTEWVSVVRLDSGDYLKAYYCTTPEEDQVMADHDGDGSYIDWEIDHYSVV